MSLFLLSASVLCFEIVSTRIASVIFVQDYAFIILSLALLGIGGGGVFSYYKIRTGDDPSRMVYRVLFASWRLVMHLHHRNNSALHHKSVRLSFARVPSFFLQRRRLRTDIQELFHVEFQTLRIGPVGGCGWFSSLPRVDRHLRGAE